MFCVRVSYLMGLIVCCVATHQQNFLDYRSVRSCPHKYLVQFYRKSQFLPKDFQVTVKRTAKITRLCTADEDNNSRSKTDLLDPIDNKDLNTIEIIRRYKYPTEIHEVTTEDGYVLQIHRIPRCNAQAIFLQHGLFDSSATFVLLGPQKSLAFLLWNAGFDVWLGNSRGNQYSTRHINMTAKDSKFWKFSWHEIGIYDIPAMIDHILEATHSSQLIYVGHSQGTTAFYVMTSVRTEYNSKIALAHHLAPVAFISHARFPLMRFLNSLLNPSGNRFFTPSSPMYSTPLSKWGCLSSTFLENVCLETLYLTMGRSIGQINRTLTPVIFSHIPAGASSYQIYHYVQLYFSGKFCGLDHGEEENYIRYGKKDPPEYDLANISAPVILYYAMNDYLVDPVDVRKLHQQLNNSISLIQIQNTRFNHIDFLWGTQSKSLVNDIVIKLTNEFFSKSFG